MNLPARIVAEAPREPVIRVDGAFPGRGLHLSHWPGHETPADLRHDLSTGCALAFARLSPAERAARAAGATAIVNNHYDTDGCAAAFAVGHPDAALARAERLLALAACGDFYRVADADAFALDCLITNTADPERSPIAGQLSGLSSLERYTRAQAFVLEALPGWLDGDVDAWRAQFEPELERYRADVAHLAECERADDPDRDSTTWVAARALDIGRHALFTATDADRVLVLERGPDGTRARLVVSTLSWFDLVSHRRLARPDLARVATHLNTAEGTTPESDWAWRAQDATNASPELWFGTAELERFAEHNAAQGWSRLAPDAIAAALQAALST